MDDQIIILLHCKFQIHGGMITISIEGEGTYYSESTEQGTYNLSSLKRINWSLTSPFMQY